MSNEQIKQKLTNLVKEERRITDEILELIELATQNSSGAAVDSNAKLLLAGASATEDLKRAKEILSQQLPGASDAEVVAYALKFLLEKTDPLRRPTSEAKSGLKRAIRQAAQGQCTYIDPQTGERCKSRHQPQLDHHLPRAKGGKSHKESLKPLCRQHSLFEAENILGRGVITPYWKKH